MHRLAVLLALIPAFAACHRHECSGGSCPRPFPEDEHIFPDQPAPMILVHITTDLPPTAVAIRSPQGAWAAATPVDATDFTAVAHGPYLVAVQCADQDGTTFSTSIEARGPNDPSDITAYCVTTPYSPPNEHVATGTMVQPGQITFADGYATSTTASWTFQLQAPTGSFDLLAQDDSSISIRRAVAITGDTALPTIDLAHEGVQLARAGFSITNAMPGETQQAVVDLENASLDFARLYDGPAASGVVAPQSILTANDDQSASLRGVAGTRYRALRKPFRAGDNPAFTLPPPTDLALSLQNGQLEAGWSHLLPAFETLSIYATSYTTTTNTFLDAEITQDFTDATAGTLLFDTAGIPGYDASHGVDFASGYQRGVLLQHVDGDQVSSEWFDESPNGFTSRTQPPRRLVRGTSSRETAGAGPRAPRMQP